MADKGTKWRPFAQDFAGTGEVRYDDFDATKAASGGDGGSRPPPAPHQSLAAAPGFHGSATDLILGATAFQDKEQRMAALRKHIHEQQAKQERRTKMRQQRLHEEAEEWKQRAQEKKEAERAERHEQLEKLKKAAAKRQQALDDSSKTQAMDLFLEDENDSRPTLFDLTSVDSLMPSIPPEFRERIRLPPMPEEFPSFKIRNPDLPKKPRVPTFRRKKDATLLPKIQNQTGVVPELHPDQPTMPVKESLRKAQAKMLRQLSGHVSFYRSHMRKNFQRIVAVTELQFGDTNTRREQASWNLAKPLSITEIKQMAAAAQKRKGDAVFE